MSELLSCPFCGGESKIEHDTDGSVYIINNHKDDCYLSGVDTTQWFYPYEGKSAEEVAAAAWNTRAERTCKLTIEMRDYERIWYEAECGFSFWWESNDPYAPFTHCPGCGAMVEVVE